jgi:hypothetical protein
MDFLSTIENSGLAAWVRESPSVWAYPTIIFLHSVGLTLVVGLSALIDLAILGYAPGLEIAPMKSLFRLIAIGFWVNLASGLLLTIADATTMPFNPIFVIKMAIICVATASVFLIKKNVFRDPLWQTKPVPASAKFLAIASLVLWTAAITAGRLTAYLGNAEIGVAQIFK